MVVSSYGQYHVTQNQMMPRDELLDPKSCSAYVDICYSNISPDMKHVANYITFHMWIFFLPGALGSYNKEKYFTFLHNV